MSRVVLLHENFRRHITGNLDRAASYTVWDDEHSGVDFEESADAFRPIPSGESLANDLGSGRYEELI